MVQLTRSRFLRQLGLSFISLCCVVIFSACGSGTPSNSTSPTTEASSNGAATTLKVALDPTFPPFQSQTGDGKFEGFDIDLINAVAEAEGLKLDMQGLPFDGIIPALQSGTVDLTISTMTITPDRAKVVNFSRPYFKSGQAIAVKEANNDITSYESLKGKKIAVQIGTVGAEKANAAQATAVRTFDNTPLALQELLNGNVDAVIADSPVVLYAIKSGSASGVKVAGNLLTEEYYGIATPQGSPSLEKINAGLKTIIENGKYKQIYQKWFGNIEPPQLPDKA
ncbi:MAG TPA: basic amino acid ABC transporter substrate-binding protein [Trichocoleus sp.]|jgi:arginine/lysine/histidine/glutamine transport system substrate-binding/permease protein